MLPRRQPAFSTLRMSCSRIWINYSVRVDQCSTQRRTFPLSSRNSASRFGKRSLSPSSTRRCRSRGPAKCWSTSFATCTTIRSSRSVAGTQPLEGLVQTLVKEGHFPTRLAAYADMVRGLGNVGTHGFDKGVSSQDVLNSLSNLMPIVEWFFEHRNPLGTVPADQTSASAIGPTPVVPTAGTATHCAVPRRRQILQPPCFGPATEIHLATAAGSEVASRCRGRRCHRGSCLVDHPCRQQFPPRNAIAWRTAGGPNLRGGKSGPIAAARASRAD